MTDASPSDAWYIGHDGRQVGPYRWRIVEKLAAAHKLAPRDYLWREGMAEWVHASRFPGLFAPAPVVHEVAEPAGAHFILQHWRGQLSLPFSYWINGSLASIVVVVLLVGIQTSGLDDLGVVASGLAMIGMLTVAYACTIWQQVGVWRSARRHVARGGSRVWATTAQVMTVLAALGFVVQAFEQEPLWKQSILLAVGREDIPPSELALTDDSTVLDLSGGLTLGTAAAFESMIVATPSIRSVRLNSGGGWISEGLKLESLIAKRGLVTITDDECASACLLAYLGGKERLLAKGARLGFHQTSVAGVGGGVASEGDAQFRSVLRRKGLPEAFIEEALSAPPDEMWYPTNAELLEANVITRLVE